MSARAIESASDHPQKHRARGSAYFNPLALQPGAQNAFSIAGRTANATVAYRIRSSTARHQLDASGLVARCGNAAESKAQARHTHPDPCCSQTYEIQAVAPQPIARMASLRVADKACVRTASLAVRGPLHVMHNQRTIQMRFRGSPVACISESTLS